MLRVKLLQVRQVLLFRSFYCILDAKVLWLLDKRFHCFEAAKINILSLEVRCGTHLGTSLFLFSKTNIARLCASIASSLSCGSVICAGSVKELAINPLRPLYDSDGTLSIRISDAIV